MSRSSRSRMSGAGAAGGSCRWRSCWWRPGVFPVARFGRMGFKTGGASPRYTGTPSYFFPLENPHHTPTPLLFFELLAYRPGSVIGLGA